MGTEKRRVDEGKKTVLLDSCLPSGTRVKPDRKGGG
jgi:hypothetical protein